MTLVSLLHPATILFIIGFGFGLLSPQLHSRRKMMLAKFMGDGFMGMYLITVGGLAGACGALIAATGALIQGLLPINAFHKTVWIRIGTAVILSLAQLLFYHSPASILFIKNRWIYYHCSWSLFVVSESYNMTPNAFALSIG